MSLTTGKLAQPALAWAVRRTWLVKTGIIVAEPRGRLIVLATPIGNLGDLSPRARSALAEADLIAAEDTRHSGQLLTQLGLSRPLISLHEHNERSRVTDILQRLQEGRSVALISDAGTPLVSDPGFVLVRAAVEAGIEVTAIPGPSAVTMALSVAGLPTDRFSFEGFLPAKAGERRRELARLATETRTLVFFESPHRIEASLGDLAEVLGAGRPALIARELTKAHETLYRGTLGELAARAAGEPNLARGELTLVVQGALAAAHSGDEALLRRALPLLLAELPPARAAAVASQLSGVPRQQAYALALQLAGRDADRGADAGADAGNE
ncbi:MAG: 16S rRNA (cytidine(1402)-2'-O)-methyltransferase [Steroidobacteraceae bacterium]